jgi:hypothetical protein
MTDDDLDFGFGSIVEVDIYGHNLHAEIVGDHHDNRDLAEGTYIAAFGADADLHDRVSSEEIIHESQVVEVHEP